MISSNTINADPVWLWLMSFYFIWYNFILNDDFWLDHDFWPSFDYLIDHKHRKIILMQFEPLDYSMIRIESLFDYISQQPSNLIKFFDLKGLSLSRFSNDIQWNQNDFILLSDYSQIMNQSKFSIFKKWHFSSDCLQV
jgi:hypothetical protein